MPVTAGSIWANRKRRWRRHAHAPLKGPFRITAGAYYSTGRPHWAMDIAPILWRYARLYAVRDAVVLDCHDGESDHPPERYSGMPSNWIILGWRTKKGKQRSAFYQHLRKGSVRVRKGQRVKAGQWIARMGTSGNTSGLHLHFSLHRGWITGLSRYSQMTDTGRPWPPSRCWLKPKSRR
jgi:murein DD-endopeptidase MepM/ murein hydrolase activator NlpD